MAKNREKIEVLNRAALWCLHNRTGRKSCHALRHNSKTESRQSDEGYS